MDVPRPIRARPRLRRIVLVVIALIALGGVTFGFRWLRGRAPEVDASTLWIATVERGPLRLEVHGTGTLVPEEVRWASAPAGARIEKVLVQPGANVTANTELVELSNPDLELAVLDAERDVSAAEAELARLAASLDAARLAQESTIASLSADHTIADRRALADQGMADNGVVSDLDSKESSDRADELGGRLRFEKQRLAALRRGNAAQLEAQRGQVDRLRQIAAFRQRQLDALIVRAGTDGVVAEVAVEAGQTVTVGAPLARIVRPDRLKAELRIPETSAQDLAIGQRATIDTGTDHIEGEVARIDPAAQNGALRVDVRLTGPLPKGARPDLTVDGTITLADAGDVLHVGRPAIGEAHATVSLFVVRGADAVRVPVTFGRASVDQIEITGGVVEGDRVILSDMSRWEGTDHLRLE
jgi:HlyD family secretion protein